MDFILRRPKLMTRDIIIQEKIYCCYCKQPINQNKVKNFHTDCEKLVKKYNSGLASRLRRIFYLHSSIKQKLKWEKNKNRIYSLIYSVGGINILGIIIIYQLLFGLRI